MLWLTLKDSTTGQARMNGEETWGGKQDKRTPLNIFIKQICMSHEEYVYHGGVFNNIILHVLPPPLLPHAGTNSGV